MISDRVRWLPSRLIVLVSALLLAGCQTFQPVTADELERGDRLRLHLNEESDVELRQVTARDVTSVNGETVEVRDGEFIMSAFSVRRADGGVVPAQGWTVRFPMDRIEAIHERRLDGWRTAGLVAGIAVATFFGWDSLAGGEDAASGGNGGNQTN